MHGMVWDERWTLMIYSEEFAVEMLELMEIHNVLKNIDHRNNQNDVVDNLVVRELKRNRNRQEQDDHSEEKSNEKLFQENLDVYLRSFR